MKKALMLSLLSTSILTACGGGSSSEKELVQPIPQVNTAPTAMSDTGLVQNNIEVLLDVLANDTDGEGDALSIASIVTEPENGTVSISDNKLVYTPNNNFAGSDSIEYQISDGELTANASVNLTVNHTMTLKGLVTDSPIANAEVTIEVSGETYTAIADETGGYELPITINNMDSLIEIRAVGSADNSQENVVLISVVGAASKLLTQVDEDRELSNEENAALNATHLSTATYFLAKDRNGGKEITSAEVYEAIKSELATDEILSTAGFIKLLIDNPAFEIPENETVLTVLEGENSEGDAASTAEAINEYLVENELINETTGEATEEYKEALGEAIEETVSDPNVVDQFTTEMLSGKMIIQLPGAREGWHEYAADGLVFKADNTLTAFSSFSFHQPIQGESMSWEVVDGKLMFGAEEPEVTTHYTYFPFDDLVNQFGFSVEFQNALMQATYNGSISDGFEIELSSGYGDRVVTLLGQTDNSYQVNVSGEFEYSITVPQGVVWPTEIVKASEQSDVNTTYSFGHQSAFTDKTLEDIAGDWVFYIKYAQNSYWDLQEVSSLKADKVTLTATQASGHISEQTFTPELIDGVLVLTNEELVYKYTPFMSAGNTHLAKVERWVSGKLQSLTAHTIAKFDDNSYADFTENLVTSLPEAYISHINSSIPESWDGDMLKLENIFGYIFSADGTLQRGISGILAEDAWDEIEQDHFNMGTEWLWNQEGRMITMSHEYIDPFEASYSRKRERTWDVLSVDESGRAIVLEYSFWTYDQNEDGIFSEDEQTSFIQPRINIQKKEDLSQWQEAWQNTLDAGLVEMPQSLAPKVQQVNKKQKQKIIH